MAVFRTPRLESAVPPKRGKGDPAFTLRIVSAIVLAPVALLIAYQGGWALAGFVTFFAVAMSYEWVKMSDPKAPPRAYSMFAAIVSGASALAGADAWGWVFGVMAIGAALMAYERVRRHGVWRDDVWRAIFGVPYVGLPCVAIIWLGNGQPGGFYVLLYLFAVVWMADSFAYLVGTWIGGPKLWVRASPNKTWSGLIAGLVAGAAAGAAAASLMGGIGDAWIFAAIGVPLALSAVCGDLLESALKRRFGVKDTGTLIPGHGGVLDRVDALIAAVLVLTAVLLTRPELFESFHPGL